MEGADGLNTAAHWLGVVLMCAYLGLAAVLMVRYFRTALGMEDVSSAEESSGGCAALKAFLASRAMLGAAAMVFFLIIGSSVRLLPACLRMCLERWDASHYLGLIENWYVTQGDARLHLVFMPLYPAIGRGLYLLGIPAFAAAMLVSNGALLGCGYAMHALVKETYGGAAANRTVWLFMLCPVTFFYSMPYTESIFLLTTLLAVLMARRQRFGWAVLFGALAANARIVGAAAAIPIFWELLAERRKRGLTASGAAVCVVKTLPVLLGTFAYFALNWQLHGDPLKFLEFQRENWGQAFGSLAWTAQYTLVYAVRYSDVLNRLGVWIPQAAALIGVPALMACRWRRQHPGDAAYGIVTFYASFAPTYLLSGVRYASAIYSLWPMLGAWLKGRWFAAVLAIESVLMVCMTVLGLCMGYVL